MKADFPSDSREKIGPGAIIVALSLGFKLMYLLSG
jgi:hypothetical protein